MTLNTVAAILWFIAGTLWMVLNHEFGIGITQMGIAMLYLNLDGVGQK